MASSICFAYLSSYHVFYHFLAAAPTPASSLAHLQTFSNSLSLPSLPASQLQNASMLTPSLPTLLAPLTPSGAISSVPLILTLIDSHTRETCGEDPGTALHRYEGASPRQYRPDGETGSIPPL